MVEDRKIAEIEWSDMRRQIDPRDKKMVDKYWANQKYYSVVRRTLDFISQWIKDNCKDKDVFEMACGNGGHSYLISEVAKSCTAADIAPMSIQQAIERVGDNENYKKIKFMVLDCENTGLPDNSFDVVFEGGALHHMDLNRVYKEAVRLLRPEGKFFCVEAIRHNPLIHLYRKLTPHLRTKWESEHILGKKEIMLGLSFFDNIELSLFHITSLCAVPLRNTFLFNPVLTLTEKLDELLVKIPCLKWMAWQSIFVLSNPRKSSSGHC